MRKVRLSCQGGTVRSVALLHHDVGTECGCLFIAIVRPAQPVQSAIDVTEAATPGWKLEMK